MIALLGLSAVTNGTGEGRTALPARSEFATLDR
jgi:hypothetical protein